MLLLYYIIFNRSHVYFLILKVIATVPIMSRLTSCYIQKFVGFIHLQYGVRATQIPITKILYLSRWYNLIKILLNNIYLYLL